MKNGKRLFSILLTLVMLVGLVPGMSLTVLAEDTLTIDDLVTAVGTSTFISPYGDAYTVHVVEGKLMNVSPWDKEEARDLTYNSVDGKYHLKFGIYDNDWYIVIDSDNYITSFMADNGGTYDSYSGKSQYALNLSAPATAVTSVTLNPSAAQTIDVDGKVSFTATVLPDGATDKTVKWSVGGTNASAVKLYSNEACTIEVGADATSTLTVYAKGISAGSATVTCTSNADSTKSATCDVTVNKANPTAPAETVYYLWGSMTSYDSSNMSYLFSASETDGVYSIANLSLTAGAAFKVMDSNVSIYPEGTTDAYSIDTDGAYNIYFRPDGNGGDGWYEGYIKVESAAASEPEIAPEPAAGGYYAAYDVTTDTNQTKIGDELTALRVTFNGRPWYIIQDNSTSATEGTVTLLYADAGLGTAQFDTNGSNVYANSSIKTALNNMTATGTYKKVAEAIKDTAENGKLYLLSDTEAEAVPLNVRKDFNSDAWWLRTPANGNTVKYVFVNDTIQNNPGRIPSTGVSPTVSTGVRPALQLDLSKVIFNSTDQAFYIPSAAPTDITVTGATLVAGYGAGRVSVTATAADGHTLSYQWYQSTTKSNEGGEKIDGATSATYDIPTGKTAGDYYYYCVVTATRTDNSQTASVTSDVATVTVAADTDELVAKLAEEKGIDLSQYYLIPAEDMYFTFEEYWNQNSSWERLLGEDAKNRIGTKQFTIQGLPKESLIFCKAYYAFDAVAWESDTGKRETIGKRYSLLTTISDQFDWWNNYSLFGFNLTKYAEGDFNTIEEADLSSISDAFRIYVPKPADAAEVNGTEYPTVAAAIRAAGEGDTVKLLRDVTENVELRTGTNIVLDLNGHKLTNDGRHSTIVAQNGSTLVVTGNGTVDNTTHGCAPLYNNGGTVTLNGGEFIRSKEAGMDGGNTYYTVVNRGTMTINEGVAIVNDTANYSSLIVNGYNVLTQTGYREIDPKVSNGYVEGESAASPTLTINGGTFKGGNQTLKNDVNGVATISGGKFSSTTGNAVKNLSELTISGGTFTAETEGKFVLFSATESGKTYGPESASGTATVTGGTFIGKLQKDEGAALVISGGEFSEVVPQEYCAEGYSCAVTTNANGKYPVLKNSAVTTEPTANTLTYNGQTQELVTAGVADGGTMQYALGSETEATGEYTASIPSRTDAGTYYVWYKVAGDANHHDTAAEPVTVTVAKAEITITADDKSSKYGEDIAELTYQIGGAYKTGDDLGVTVNTTATKTSDVGEYEITVDWNKNSNYTATLTNGKYTITKTALSVTATGYSGAYDSKAHGITVDVGAADATVYYAETELTADNYTTAGSTTAITRTDAGTTTVYYYVAGKNYDAVSGSKTVEITKADGAAAEPAEIQSWTQEDAVVTATAGQEYVIVPKGETPDWTKAVEGNADGFVAFENLTPATEYDIYTRVKEDANHNPGAAVKTDLLTSLYGIEMMDEAVVGETITVKPDPADAEGLSYQWYYTEVDGDSTRRGAMIAGANSATYAIGPADYGKTLCVVISKNGVELDEAFYGPVGAVYKVTDVTGVTGTNEHVWTKDSGKDVVVTVKLTDVADDSFTHFESVEIDGVALERDKDYTVKEGSTIVTLKAATLQKLSVGKHEVTVWFDNGCVDVDLTVKAAASTGSGTAKSDSPKTGDESSVGLWIAVMTLCGFGIASTVLYGRKKKTYNR